MRALALPSILACSLALATVPQGALAAAPSKGKSTKGKSTKGKGKGKPAVEQPVGGGGSDVPEPDAGASERVGRVFIDANGLGDAGPVLAGRMTRVSEGAFRAESVSPTDAPAGPELRVTLEYRDDGGYAARYEIVYDGDVIEDGSGSFECQLCTEDELVEKVEALARQVAPKMMVPQEPEEPANVAVAPDDGGELDTGGPEDPVGDEDPGKLRGMGKAGVGLLAIGGLTAIGGVVMVALQPIEFPAGDPNANMIRTTRPPGWGVLGGGAALVVVGAVLLGIDRKRAKQRRVNAARSSTTPKVEAAVHPWLGGHGGGLGVTGRF
ncbi:MAG: hypothetical protein AAGF11_54980 [Myxococcota bacterium]